MDFLTERCRANPPIREDAPVRMPGEQAERNIAAARTQGVPVDETTVQQLAKAARKWHLEMPAPLQSGRAQSQGAAAGKHSTYHDSEGGSP
jgi:hypothetical protein